MAPTVAFESAQQNLNYTGVWDIDPRDLLKHKTHVKIVDVRQPDEFTGELGHIPGAQLLVLDTLTQKLGQLSKDEIVVFVCRSGGRSARAASYALGQGYKHVFNLKGGMLLWNELQLETET